MNLLQQYSRVNLLTSILIFLLASVAFYFSLHYVLIKQVDEDLKAEKHEIEISVQRYGKLPEIILMNDEVTTYKETSTLNPPVAISSILVKGADEDMFRMIKFSLPVREKVYEVTVAKSLENTEDITKSVLTIAAVSIFILAIAGFIVNRILLKHLWKPFYKSMMLIKQYRIGQQLNPVFEKTNITEFAMLNDTLSTTLNKSEDDYQNLKEFTENAAHEMQTPLAVVRSKMDVLIQDEQLSEAQSNIVHGAYEAIKKLAKLNQALLLLTKIENRQYEVKEAIPLHTIIEEKIFYFNELLQNRNLSISLNLAPVMIHMNAALADILLNNLISNSIKHSKKGDNIKVLLTAEKLIIKNGPGDKPLDANNIFKRFYKGNNSPEEHGLGLAIVKEICMSSGFTVHYTFEESMHSFVVNLSA